MRRKLRLIKRYVPVLLKTDGRRVVEKREGISFATYESAERFVRMMLNRGRFNAYNIQVVVEFAA